MPKSVFTDANRAVFEALIAARKAAGLRQEDVARTLNKPQSFVSRVEQGERRIDLIEFCAFARAVGANPVKLYGEIVERFPSDLSI